MHLIASLVDRLRRFNHRNEREARGSLSQFFVVRHRIHALFDCRRFCGSGIGYDADISRCYRGISCLRAGVDDFIGQLFNLLFKWC